MTTWHFTSARIAGLSLAAFALSAAPIEAATVPSPATASYVIQSVINQPDGSMSATELLTIASANGTATVTVTQPSTGAAAHATAPIDANGIVSIVSSDPALACYNNAQGIIANGSSTKPSAALAVSFAGTSFAVPLRVGTSASTRGMQDFTFTGSVEGSFAAMPQSPIAIVIDGNVHTQMHQLASVELRETTVLTASRAAIAQTTCSMKRVINAPASIPI